MNYLTNFSEFLNESAFPIHLQDMLDQLGKAERDLMSIDDEHAREIKGVLRKMIGDLSHFKTVNEIPDSKFMQNLVSSLTRLKEQGKAIPFSKYPDFSQMKGEFTPPLASLQRSIDKAKHMLGFTV